MPVNMSVKLNKLF